MLQAAENMHILNSGDDAKFTASHEHTGQRCRAHIFLSLRCYWGKSQCESQTVTEQELITPRVFLIWLQVNNKGNSLLQSSKQHKGFTAWRHSSVSLRKQKKTYHFVEAQTQDQSQDHAHALTISQRSQLQKDAAAAGP